MANKYIDDAVIEIHVQSGTDRTFYVTTEFPKPSWVSQYRYRWQYCVDDGIWYFGTDKNEETTHNYSSAYTPPNNATQVKVHVYYKSKTHKVKGKNKAYFTSGWHAWVTYVISSVAVTPAVPSAPSVEIDKFSLTASHENISDANTTHIRYEAVQDNKTVQYGSYGLSEVVTGHAAFEWQNIEAGHSYKVRAQGVNISDEGVEIARSEWSEYSDNASTIPSTPGIPSVAVNTATQATVTWDEVPNATEYTLEYTTDKSYFDTTTEVQSVTISTGTTAILTGLTTGVTLYFRLKATNSQGDSGWSDIVSAVIGKIPAAPTTWSETSTAAVGDTVYLYWVHNSQDGSKESYAKVELTVGSDTTIEEIQNERPDEETTGSYEFDTSDYTDGTTLYWRVKTQGVLTEGGVGDDGGYGEWSAQRAVTINAPATLTATVTPLDTSSTTPPELTTYPLGITLSAGPSTQNAVVYNIQVKANDSYDTVDYIGRDTYVKAGDSIFSRNYNASSNELSVEIGAGDLNLENGKTYTLIGMVAMSSGLSATVEREFEVVWPSSEYYLDAAITFDDKNIATYIQPYAVDEDDEAVSNLDLSVYRREFDGSFQVIGSGIDSESGITVVDPHPALDYARYRVVAVNKLNGQTDFYDLPDYPIEEKAIIIQWDETWRDYSSVEDVEDETDRPVIAGSMLRLPYNIDVQDKYNMDVTFASYIGRSHPVSYYGTQQGMTSSWKTDIPAYDTETIFALRRLSVYQGDVYVREPSGTGYWANVKVSFSINHLAVTIPVTLDITRVVGGISRAGVITEENDYRVGDITFYIDNNHNLRYDKDIDTEVDFYLGTDGHLYIKG